MSPADLSRREPTPAMNEQIAREYLEARGLVVLREKSYRQAQERQRIAEALRAAEEDRRESVERWAREECAEQRRLRERLTFVYGVARAHGASVAELSADSEVSS